MALKLFLLLGIISFVYCSSRFNEAVDSSLLEDAIDAQECDRQIRAIRRNAMLLLQFKDSGLRTPRGILTGNTVDLGNYHQCIGIDEQLNDIHIQGKYCSILVPFNQTFHLPRPEDMMGTQFDPTSLQMDDETIARIQEYNMRKMELLALSGNFDGLEMASRSIPENPFTRMVFRLGVCVPKPCTTQQAITSFFFNFSAVGFQYREDYCRLLGDKPWVPADYTAVAIFSALGLVTLMSTCYDLCYRFILKKDVKQMSTLYRSFSVYTNGQRLTKFSTGGENLQCLDGIRTLAMLWVIVGHSFNTEPFIANPVDSQMWMFSANALWITAATMTVDTFFTLSGLLLVYTTAGKMNQITFVKNLHWFYLSRFVRLTPLMAVTVLLQASYFNRMADGPHWTPVITLTERCRKNWWSTLLHIQNWVHNLDMCVHQSWYVAIDFQLYIVSPLVLFWVLTGKKHLAWMGVIGGLAAILVGSTIYSFNLNVQAGGIVPTRFVELEEYMRLYYFNTLARASPFFVGLVFGYILHTYRKTKIQLPWIFAIFFWACSAGVLGGIFYFKYRIKQFDWDNQLVDNLMNSFMRPAYACAICWLVVACVHGYSGPINWFLSLDVWRLPARLSYGMYLLHYPYMYSINATMVTPIYFTVEGIAFKFLAFLVMAVLYSFVFTLLVDSPVTVLFKMLMDRAKKPKTAVKPTESRNKDDIDKNGMANNVSKSMKAVDDINEDNTDINSDGVNVKTIDVNVQSSKGEYPDSVGSLVEKTNFNEDTEGNDSKDVLVHSNIAGVDSSGDFSVNGSDSNHNSTVTEIKN